MGDFILKLQICSKITTAYNNATNYLIQLNNIFAVLKIYNLTI